MDADANWTQERRFLAENGPALLEHIFFKSLLGVKRGVWIDQGPCWGYNHAGDLCLTAKKTKKNLIL